MAVFSEWNQRMSNMGRTATLGKLPGSELVAVPLKFHVRALTSECRMNGGLWSYTPPNPFFSGYNFLSSNLNVEFDRGGKTKYTLLGVRVKVTFLS